MTTLQTHILGIETSCDETAASVVRSDRRIVSNLVFSQLDTHRAFGGVVPEIAARAHAEHLPALIRMAMQEAGLGFPDLAGVAATCGPGLIGGVMVGMVAGKAIAAAHGCPFLAVNHLEGHALTVRLSDSVDFPYLLFLMSGGHTQILVAEGVGRYRQWGSTIDDAAGECFDKAAKLMGLAYPGGPNLEAIAAECPDPEGAQRRFPLPRPLIGRNKADLQALDFSFSGLKTAVRTYVDAIAADLPEGGALPREAMADLACAFQAAVGDVLSDRLRRSVLRFQGKYSIRNVPVVIAGGVAANAYLRTILDKAARAYGAHLIAPPMTLCSDNAAMIAWAGIERLRLGLTDPLDFKARPRWPLADVL